MYKEIKWGQNGIPQNQTINDILTMLRNDDLQRGLLYDAPTLDDVLSQAEDVNALDGIVVDNAHLKNKMLAMRRVMNMTANSEQQVAGDPIISEPFMRAGTAQVAVIFSLVDGQAVTIYFHNPDADPKRIKPTDELVSFKFLLNKKDITIVVAPENGQDINIRQVAMRIMKLAEKNSTAFQRQNVKNAERKALISDLEAKINQKKAILTQKLETISQLESQLENPKGSDNNESTLEPEMPTVGDSNDESPTQEVDVAPKTEHDLPEDKKLKTIVSEKEARSLIKQGYVPLRNQPTSHLGELITDIKDNILPKYPTISIDDFSINDLFQRAVLELKDNKTKENFLRIEEEPDGGDVGYKVTTNLYLTNEEAHFSSYDRYDKALEYVNTEIKNYVSRLPEQAETEGSDRSNNGNGSEKTAETEKTNNLRNEKLKEVKAFLKSLQGKTITASDGRDILFSGKSKHLGSDARYGAIALEAIKRVVDVFTQGKALGYEALTKERKDFTGFYVYEKWLDLEHLNIRVKARVKAGIRKNGIIEALPENVAYTQKVVEKEPLLTSLPNSTNGTPDMNTMAQVDSIAEMDNIQANTGRNLTKEKAKLSLSSGIVTQQNEKGGYNNRDQLRVAADDATANFDGTQEEWADNDALLTIVDIEPLTTALNPLAETNAQNAIPESETGTHANTFVISGEVKPFNSPEEEKKYFSVYRAFISDVKARRIKYNPVKPHSRPLNDKEIIERISGGDETKGSCVSVGLCYIANKLGLDVLDFRGGRSCKLFSNKPIEAMHLARANRINLRNMDVEKLLKEIVETIQENEEYALCFGKHFSIVRKQGRQFQYLELQSETPEENTFRTLNTVQDVYDRFNDGAKPRVSQKYQMPAIAILWKLSEVQKTDEFMDILGYFNTQEDEQQKGENGYAK